jgi:predicted small lipoprotein YifL
MSIRRSWFVGIILVALATAFTGCGKKEPTGKPGDAISVDTPKLRREFANAQPDQKTLVDQAIMAIRYGKNEEAVAALEKLVASPGLNDSQKKALTDTVEQIKKLPARSAQ